MLGRRKAKIWNEIQLTLLYLFINLQDATLGIQKQVQRSGHGVTVSHRTNTNYYNTMIRIVGRYGIILKLLEISKQKCSSSPKKLLSFSLTRVLAKLKHGFLFLVSTSKNNILKSITNMYSFVILTLLKLLRYKYKMLEISSISIVHTQRVILLRNS